MRPRMMSEAWPGSEWKPDRIEETATLVGYSSPEGHNHDDNCIVRTYICKNGHTMKISKQRRCPACDWVGKLLCACHYGSRYSVKLEDWPENY